MPSALSKEDRILALGVSQDLCRKLLEKRFLSARDAPAALELLGRAGLRILRAYPAPGFPCLRLAASLTGRLVERGRLSSVEAASRNLAENAAALHILAGPLPPESKRPLAQTAVDLVLKMLETVTLSSQAIPFTLKTLVESASKVLLEPVAAENPETPETPARAEEEN
ncbi:MAG: hypothetical protein LBO66_06175 [Deltaproteobacteria bacterium]|jgi:hypothetical protein|nr:hypothetical protein [Deltaproteobacteria bacterium]